MRPFAFLFCNLHHPRELEDFKYFVNFWDSGYSCKRIVVISLDNQVYRESRDDVNNEPCEQIVNHDPSQIEYIHLIVIHIGGKEGQHDID